MAQAYFIYNKDVASQTTIVRHSINLKVGGSRPIGLGPYWLGGPPI